MHARRILQGPSGLAQILCVLSVSMILGCETGVLPEDLASSRDNPNGQTGGLVSENSDADSAFAEAQPAAMPVVGTVTIDGTIDGIDDIDVYALGSANAGDRITVDVEGHDGINLVAALFNADTDLIDANDDRSYYAQLLNPYISRVIRHDAANLFVGVAVSSGTHFASNSGRYDSGSYTIRVTRQPGNSVLQPRSQVVYMDFAGGASVQIGSEPVITMRPFSAESISSRLDGQTDYIMDVILARMAADYAPYDVTLLNSRDHARPTGAHTMLYFGNYHSSYLGLADNVDTFNSSLSQEAIIYAEDISMFESLRPSADEVGAALANIAAHELGHLLGLEHSRNQGDIMATAASARQILENNLVFTRSYMQTDVFPIGYQNEPTLLLWNVGASPNANARLIYEDASTKSNASWRDKEGLADIPIIQCGCPGCSGHHHHD